MQAQQCSWVPPEAVAAAADAAEQHGSWTCSTCTLNNAPQVAAACLACYACLLLIRSITTLADRNSWSARLMAIRSCVAQATACEACGSGRQQPSATSQAGESGSADPAGRAGEARSKPKKVSKFERTRGLSLSSGDPDATRRWLQSNGAAPELAAPRGASGGPREPGQPRGMWAKQGQLAQQMRVVQDAYGNV